MGAPVAGNAADPAVTPAADHRQTLADWGVQFSATYIGETLADVSGGMRRGAIYAGRLDLGTTIDLDRLLGWRGATFHANMFQIHGNGLSRNYVGNLLLVSGIESLPATRLYEAWIEQSLLGGALSIKAGQQSADTEFIDSRYLDMFVNAALGWPGLTGAVLPSGGPSPPLAVPGIRIKAQLGDNLTASVAVFDGDAAPPGPGDPQIRNPNGLLFRVHDPAWLIGQVKYGFGNGNGMPSGLTAGAWYHFGEFDSQRFTAQGVSIVDPAGSGLPARLRGDQGVFAVIEQPLAHSAADPAKGTGFVARVLASPSDRNLVSFYVDAALLFTGFSRSRPDDKFGVAISYARISDAARGLDRDLRRWSGVASPIRDFEAVIELTYLAQITGNFALQPVIEYVMHPAGGATDPFDPAGTRRIRDALVLGIRTTLSY
ncbi:carbohydrate porin [Rhodopseudomonas palustris]|uniref:carbohydrate porin n=1 Tax=Rhodopseudomonas palustris TaxID=1076 RepID=UPI002ACE96BE|nr:carbohydrate porin [Rhodopseudomonas palustris]WQG99941.1 carbohydrate porin [Rhodopseudomonas palustris]